MSKYSNKLEQGMILKTVMANFLCQLHWAMGCPDIWSNLLLGMSRRVFLDEVNIWIGRLDKADCLPSCGRALSNQRKPEQDKKTEEERISPA